ncbi:very short patch repair endonuclease, partial [Patescibacteria group bacterium]|nr:very short patch repair endonuclease [Patescibacteria group bacterium]
MDVHTKEQRSYNMTRVKSKNTLPEKLMFKAFKKEGVKFIKHSKKIPGKPDITIP